MATLHRFLANRFRAFLPIQLLINTIMGAGTCYLCQLFQNFVSYVLFDPKCQQNHLGTIFDSCKCFSTAESFTLHSPGYEQTILDIS
jgi:hypothetical protein